VILQEWWGLVGHIKDVAERFGREGFITLAPDLYHGETAEEPNEARKLAMALDRKRAIREITGAVNYLLKDERVAPKKIGLVGWCMGGGLCLSAAAEVQNIGAVAFYGRPLEAGDTAKIEAPALGLYGELDRGIPVSLVRDFEAELAGNGIEHEIEIYAGAEHAFFNEERPQAYHPEAAEDAWVKTLGWLRRHLIEGEAG
jgi:carboxymethylenebutenolidase